MTNAERAERARVALTAYINHTNDTPDESHFRDLLTDLMHLAAADPDVVGEGISEFDQALQMARVAFDFEQENEDG